MHYPIALAEGKISVPLLFFSGGGRIEHRLQREVEIFRAGFALSRRTEHLNFRRGDAHVFRQARLAELRDRLHDRLRVAPPQEKEVAVGAVQHRKLAVVDRVRVHNDEALAGLPEDFGQTHRLHAAAPNEVGKQIPRADRGQLIRVADQNQAALRLQRAEQRRHQLQVDHRRLVNDQRVAGQRLILVVEERHHTRFLVKLALEQPVNCGRLAPCTLGEALGRASGRRGQQRLDLHQIKECQNAGHDRRLARARPARHDQQLPLRRHADGLALLRGIGQRLDLLGPIHQRLQIRWGFQLTGHL